MLAGLGFRLHPDKTGARPGCAQDFPTAPRAGPSSRRGQQAAFQHRDSRARTRRSRVRRAGWPDSSGSHRVLGPRERSAPWPIALTDRERETPNHRRAIGVVPDVFGGHHGRGLSRVLTIRLAGTKCGVALERRTPTTDAGAGDWALASWRTRAPKDSDPLPRRSSAKACTRCRHPRRKIRLRGHRPVGSPSPESQLVSLVEEMLAPVT